MSATFAPVLMDTLLERPVSGHNYEGYRAKEWHFSLSSRCINVSSTVQGTIVLLFPGREGKSNICFPAVITGPVLYRKRDRGRVLG